MIQFHVWWKTNEIQTMVLSWSKHISQIVMLLTFVMEFTLKSHHPFSSKRHALQIQLNYSDFETANPLGSKCVIHKSGCIYLIASNLHPKCNVTLIDKWFCDLLSLFYTPDLHKYGFDVKLELLTNLCETTKRQRIPFSDEPVCGTISQITGDDLRSVCFVWLG